MTFLPSNLIGLTCFVTSINYFGGRTPNVWVKKVELLWINSKEQKKKTAYLNYVVPITFPWRDNSTIFIRTYDRGVFEGPCVMLKTAMTSVHSKAPNSPAAISFVLHRRPIISLLWVYRCPPSRCVFVLPQWFHQQPHWANKPRLMRPSVDVQEVMVAADRSFAVSQHRVNYDSSPINSMGKKWAFPPQGCCAPQLRK